MLPNVHSVRAPEESARDFVYRVLALYIRELFLRPGERVAETDVAQTLRVSRTPVHDTFSRLEHERMLRPVPRGAVVTALDVDAIRQALWMRRLTGEAVLGELYNHRPAGLEPLEQCVAAEYRALNSGTLIAMAKLHREFYAALYALCGRTPVLAAIERTTADAYRLLRLVDSEDFWRYVVECHAALVQGLALHDHEAAVAALTREFDLYEPLLAECMARRPDYFAA